jgi:hypothetical protein
VRITTFLAYRVKFVKEKDARLSPNVVE